MRPVEQVRDRFATREVAAMTPAERLARMEVLQAEVFERLRQSPEAWDRFMRRNLRQRAIRANPRDSENL